MLRGCAPYVEWLGMKENPTGRGWASAKNLYVRAIDGDKITVSIFKYGAITGSVHRKYVNKV